MKHDPYTPIGRKAMMDERDRLYSEIWKELDQNDQDETDRYRELSDQLQDIMGLLYRTNMLSTAFAEHKTRKAKHNGM